MKSSKLFQVYSLLSRKEKKHFATFVRSPFHNKHPRVITLADYLFTYFESNEDEIKKEVVFSHLFPGEPYKDFRMRHILSYAVTCLKRFLVFQELELRPAELELFFIDALQKRDKGDLLKTQLSFFQKSLEANSFRSENYLGLRFQLLLRQNSIADIRTTAGRESLQDMTHQFDQYLIANKLSQACALATHRTLYASTYEIKLLKPILEIVEAQSLYKIPAIGIYYYCYKTITAEKDTASFGNLKRLLVEWADLFPKIELRNLYMYAINYCIRKINKSDESFRKEVFDLYRSALEGEVLFEYKVLSPWTFKNIVSVGLKLGEYDWLNSFIKEYEKFLPVEYRESFRNFSLASLEFQKGHFTSSVRLLQNLEIKDLFVSLDAKVLMFKSWYELGDFRYIEYLLENFRQMVRRKKMQSYHDKNYKNFIRLAKKLLNSRPDEKAWRTSFEQEVRREEILGEREWFLQKVREM